MMLTDTWVSAAPSAVANQPRTAVRWPWATRATRRARERVLQWILVLCLVVTCRQVRTSLEKVMPPRTGSPIRIDQARVGLVADAPLESRARLLASQLT